MLQEIAYIYFFVKSLKDKNLRLLLSAQWTINSSLTFQNSEYAL